MDRHPRAPDGAARRLAMAAGAALALIVLLLPSAASAAQFAPIDDETLTAIGTVLFVFLVLSIIFEAALTPLFNWRIFVRHFEGRGVKTPIVVVLAFVFFWSFGLDIVSEVLAALTTDMSPEPTFGGQVLTALLIAGGSDGIFRIFTRLKIRDPAERVRKAREERQPASLRLELERARARGPVTVLLDGTIRGEIAADGVAFSLDDIAPGTHTLTLEGRDQNGGALRQAETLEVGPGARFSRTMTI